MSASRAAEERVEEATMQKITIPVTGMSCAGCAGRVQRALEDRPGVGEAVVDLKLASATVVYDPSQTSVEALVEAIRATGYGAELPAIDARESPGSPAT
ncbi:MAG TPA: heavy metal-associated domain-containing protein [Longimicrobiales bacterium]